MPKDKISDYSATASSNTDVGGIGIQGTDLPSNLDNGLREIMSHLAEMNAGTYPLHDTFTVADPADTTKKFRVDAGRIPTATTIVHTPLETGYSATHADLKGYIYGLTLSNNVTDPTNDIDIAVGRATDSDNNEMMVLSSALTKRLDATWAVGTNQGGLDTGTVANATYHVWLIERTDTGVVDVLFSTSATAPTMPTNYDRKRRIGSIVRGASAINRFVQDGDLFLYDTPVLDVSATNPGTSAVTQALTVPTGIVVYPLMHWSIRNDTTAQIICYVSPLSLTNNVPSTTYSTLRTDATTGGGQAYIQHIPTNTSAQIRYRLSASGASDILRCSVQGWRDNRGK